MNDYEEVLSILNKAYTRLEDNSIAPELDWAINIVRLSFEQLESMNDLAGNLTSEFTGNIQVDKRNKEHN